VNGEFIAFFILSVFAIGGAVFFLSAVRVMHMTLSLAFSFFSLAGIYLLLQAEFLAVVQVLIYTGAISILMIFGIMLTKPEEGEASKAHRRHHWFSLVVVTIFFIVILGIIYQLPISTPTAEVPNQSIQNLGITLFQQYAIPFELASVLLLVALIGAIILARKEQE
jgi:NADH-quinone oxidoreductase subunit J